MAAQRILLDTDIGTDVDDAIALALLLASPELDLSAVTIVSGDVGLRGRIARKVLALAGRDDIPVAAGVRKPVLQQRNFLWLGHEGKGIVEAEDSLPLAATHGVDLLIDTVRRERPHVLAIGPLSNLAVALMKDPDLAQAVPRLTLMGGSLGIASDPTVPLVEYNLGSDAEASVVVLNAGMPTTIVPLDVTWKTFLKPAQLERLRQSRSRLVHAVCDAMDIWWPLHRELLAGARTYSADVVAFLHDPLTVAVLVDRSFVKTEHLPLRPEIADGWFRLRRDESGPTFEVVVDVDAPAFVDCLIERLERLP
jgi:purine nucleosidase